jgi:hypothetical protein
VGGISAGSCPVEGHFISGMEPSGNDTTELGGWLISELFG